MTRDLNPDLERLFENNPDIEMMFEKLNAHTRAAKLAQETVKAELDKAKAEIAKATALSKQIGEILEKTKETIKHAIN